MLYIFVSNDSIFNIFYDGDGIFEELGNLMKKPLVEHTIHERDLIVKLNSRFGQ